MINFMIRLRGYLLLFLAIIYLIYIFTGWFASLFIIVVALLVFIVSFPFMSPLPRLMAFIMIGIGQFLFFWYGGTWAYWSEAIIKNLPLVALFVTVPLLSIPLRTGGYVAYMVSVMRRFFKTPVMIHTAIAGCALILTSFINLGSVRVLDELFGSELRRKKSLSVKAITQGFSLAAMMSPYIAGVAIVLYLLEVSFIPFLFYGMFMAVCGIGISMGLNFLAFRNTTLPAQESAASNDTRTFQGSDANDERTKGKGAQLFLAFVGLFIAIFLLEEWLQINLIVIISLVAIVYPFLWVFLIRGRKLLPDYLQNYFKEVLPNVHNESVLIVGA
ncbi:MAG TPA: hypothetical protein VF149_02800, partial [Bacillales bacterium]